MASRSIAVLMLVVFASACATPRVVRLDTGQGQALEHPVPTTGRAVAVGEEDFEEARERGWAMTFEQAVEYALNEADHGGMGETARS